MTATGGADVRSRWPSIGDVLAVLDQWIGALLRRPRFILDPGRLRAARGRYATWLAVVGVVVVFLMVFVDADASKAVARLPHWLIEGFNEITDFGRSGWFLWPSGLLFLLLTAIAASPRLGRFPRAVYAAFAVRVGFIFVAIGFPGLVVTILKRCIGRARPSALGPFAYDLFAWRPEFASLPSGHAATAFSALIAIGAIFPRARAVMWVYASAIVVSRVVVSAHYPSDVLAGAAFGAFGAILVRQWFALRRMGFYIGPNGEVRALPGPSQGRLKKVARALFAQ